MGWDPELSNYIRDTSTGETVVRLPVRFLRINSDIAIWAAPLELFCEIAMEVRSRSPFPYTFYFGYCNGWLGYLPTREEFAMGGYEPSVSPFTERGGEDLQLQNTYFQTLAKVLAIDSWICQGAALHGLGHLHHPDTAALISRYIDEHPLLTKEQVAYAQAAAKFEVL